MNKEAILRVKKNVVKDETAGESTFFITDDLRIMQGLPGDLIQSLLNFGIKNVSLIEEKVLEIGSAEMCNLLSHLFISKMTLTDVFLRKQGILSSTAMLDEQFMLVRAPNMKESNENDGKRSVKIMLRKSDSKLLYAEASANFVDLLFSFLTIPLESVLELVDGRLLTFMDPKSPTPNTENSSGYVEKNSLFVITDNLVVKSLSSVSSISLLKEIGISVDDVEEQVIIIGEVEIAALGSTASGLGLLCMIG
ncbi:uncharacterized protein [Gossypium hirsutum]|uniref:DUF674 domain-containing protein n=1 Tax=Gossypium hirsutum TaxID=3635 RepID=A0ABM3ADX9_GOSHI|nr:uncharacterized protein LOC107960710 [Gossypium hirsutum]